MPRFPVSKELITNNKATISGDNYKHIVKVLRLKVGDRITLFDSESIEYFSRIIELTSKDLTVLIESHNKTNTESNININLFQAIPKGSKMDYIVQKATELGVKSITPILTERTNNSKDRKDRWEKIAIEACKQCGRTKPPEIHSAVDFKNLFSINNSSELKIILYENCKNSLSNHFRIVMQLPNNINIIVGPEGGFTTNEVDDAKKHGYIDLSLGPRILRTETASISLLSIIQYEFGDF